MELVEKMGRQLGWLHAFDLENICFWKKIKFYLNFVVQLSQKCDQVAEMLRTQECVGLIDKCRDLRKQHILVEVVNMHAQKLAEPRKVVLTLVQNDGLNNNFKLKKLLGDQPFQWGSPLQCANPLHSAHFFGLSSGPWSRLPTYWNSSIHRQFVPIRFAIQTEPKIKILYSLRIIESKPSSLGNSQSVPTIRLKEHIAPAWNRQSLRVAQTRSQGTLRRCQIHSSLIVSVLVGQIRFDRSFHQTSSCRNSQQVVSRQNQSSLVVPIAAKWGD